MVGKGISGSLPEEGGELKVALRPSFRRGTDDDEIRTIVETDLVSGVSRELGLVLEEISKSRCVDIGEVKASLWAEDHLNIIVW